MPGQVRPSRTREPAPPSVFGDPPMTERFNRWLYGVACPLLLTIGGVVVLVAGRVAINWPRQPLNLAGPAAYCFGAAVVIAALLLFRIRFCHGHDQVYFSDLRWYDRLLVLAFLIPTGYLIFHFAEKLIS